MVFEQFLPFKIRVRSDLDLEEINFEYEEDIEGIN